MLREHTRATWWWKQKGRRDNEKDYSMKSGGQVESGWYMILPGKSCTAPTVGRTAVKRWRAGTGSLNVETIKDDEISIGHIGSIVNKRAKTATRQCFGEVSVHTVHLSRQAESLKGGGRRTAQKTPTTHPLHTVLYASNQNPHEVRWAFSAPDRQERSTPHWYDNLTLCLLTSKQELTQLARQLG